MTQTAKSSLTFVCLAAALAIALLNIDASAAAEATEKNQPMTPQRTMPPARAPEIAVEEEYQIARQRGTAQALELFIARHPDSPLADKARADLSTLKR